MPVSVDKRPNLHLYQHGNLKHRRCRSYHFADGFWVYDSQERHLRAEKIPDAVERIKIRLIALPQRVLSGVVLRIDKGAVDATVKIDEQVPVDVVCRSLDRAELLPPLLNCRGLHAFEVEIRDLRLGIAASLLFADETDAHAGEDAIRPGAVKANETAARKGVSVD